MPCVCRPSILAVLLLGLLAVAPAAAAPLTVEASAHGLTAPGGSGGGTGLGLRWDFAERFALDVQGRSAWLHAAEGPDTIYLALYAGAAYMHPVGPGAVQLIGRLGHIHHAPARTWGETPFANLAGDSSGSVRHRSGVEGALAWLGGPLVAEQPALRWRIELNVGALPSSEELGWTAGLALALGWTLR